jgi:hypothetical protein
MSWLQGIDFNSRNLRVAQASNDKGAIRHVYFMRVDDAFLITAVVLDSKETEADDKTCGASIDMFLERLAQLEGVTRLFTVKPQTSGNGCVLVRTYTPTVTQVEALQTPSRVTYIN